jgi:predicted O-methyltransferase YrrM
LIQPNDIIKQLENPEWDTISAIRPEEAEFIYTFLKERKLSKTLEVGFAVGMSASHIIAATKKKHITIDPFQENYGQFGIKNLEKFGMGKFLDFRPDYSHNVLPQLLKEGKSFDFIFIDGDHKFDGVFVDYYYADLLLDDGGYILLHDTWMRSTRLVERFIIKNKKNYHSIKIPYKNLSLLQKRGVDQRNGMEFTEFYTFKSFLKHKVIMWYIYGKDGWLKRLATKLKGYVRK